MDTVFVYGGIGIESTSSSAGESAYAIKAAGLEREAFFSPFHTSMAVCLTMLCGMSVGLGWVGPFAAVRLNARLIGLGTGFAAGAMACLGLSASLMNFSIKTACMSLLGAALMFVVEFVLHTRERNAAHGGKAHAGSGSALAVALHNLPECFIVFSSAMAGTGLGLALGGAMIAHNVPLGISIALASGGGRSPRQARIRAAVAGLVPPLAAILAYFFLRPLFSPQAVRMLFACAGGALIFMALAELVPFARKHGKGSTVLAGFVAGVSLLLGILIFFYGNTY